MYKYNYEEVYCCMCPCPSAGASCRPSGKGTMLALESCSKAEFLRNGCTETSCGQLQCPGSFETRARELCTHSDQYMVTNDGK